MVPRPLTVYILASRSRALGACPGLRSGVGVTNDLVRRLAEHRAGDHGFTARYRIDRLVHAEEHPAPRDAIAREKQLKGWRRAKKVALVERGNPTWRDLDPSRYGWTATPGRPPRSTAARRDPSTSSG